MRWIPRLATVAVLTALVGAGLTARAAETIRVLIVDGQNNHNWKATTPVMEEILEEAKIFEVDVATSPPGKDGMDEFRPEFSKYQAVLLNYNGASWSPETSEAFVDYVQGGGGVVVVHAADNSFPRWGEFNEMIGVGGWGGRNEKDGPYVRWRDGKIVRDTTPGRAGSHGRQHAFTVTTREPLHPITFGLPVEWEHAQDELYDRMRGPAVNLTVLATAFAAPDTGGSGEHEPVLMAIDYGKGRVFHTVLGHGAKVMRASDGFQVTLVRGTEWAATGTVTVPVPESLASQEPIAGAGWTPLFDGETLEGWTQKNGTARYRVEKGTIVGTTNEGSPNSFLCTDRDYSDFELVFDVKVDDQLNSGVQIRSESKPEFNNGRVHGPQVEIATNGTAGFIYGEALGTGWLSKDRTDPEAKAAFRPGHWNRYRVLASGKSIKTWVNDIPVADLVDEESGKRSGFIGLQVHGIRRGTGPFEVRWRNLYLRDLTKRD